MNEQLVLSGVRLLKVTDATDKLNKQLQAEIAERKRVEEALRHAQAQLAEHTGRLEDTVVERTGKLQETVWELESFSYSIIHDLRAPLRALEGFSHILEKTYGEKLDDNGKDLLHRIGHAAARMDKLIVDVLNYSHVLRQDLRLTTVNMQQLLLGMLGSYPDFHAPNIDVGVEGELPAVLGNEAALTQCFSNLINNAIKFVPAGTNPRVRISAEPRGEMVRFWVNDNGIGIADQDREIIFGMFQRLHTSYPGTGIGLAIVRKTVERMGGQVGVESAPSQGSRFWLELKAAKQEARS